MVVGVGGEGGGSGGGVEEVVVVIIRRDLNEIELRHQLLSLCCPHVLSSFSWKQ